MKMVYNVKQVEWAIRFQTDRPVFLGACLTG